MRRTFAKVDFGVLFGFCLRLCLVLQPCCWQNKFWQKTQQRVGEEEKVHGHHKVNELQRCLLFWAKSLAEKIFGCTGGGHRQLVFKPTLLDPGLPACLPARLMTYETVVRLLLLLLLLFVSTFLGAIFSVGSVIIKEKENKKVH